VQQNGMPRTGEGGSSEGVYHFDPPYKLSRECNQGVIGDPPVLLPHPCATAPLPFSKSRPLARNCQLSWNNTCFLL
jgi:hypothetical protein